MVHVGTVHTRAKLWEWGGGYSALLAVHALRDAFTVHNLTNLMDTIEMVSCENKTVPEAMESSLRF